jgi:arsenate reductase
MAKIIVYEKPTCSTCRAADKILREAGEDYEKINYYVEPISEAKLRELLVKLKMRPDELIRKKEPIYKELGIAAGQHSDDELIKLMAQHPDLIQRPIVECGNKAVLGRPVENIREIL